MPGIRLSISRRAPPPLRPASAIAALPWGPSPLHQFRPSPWDPGRQWSLSRRRRNRLLHALNGNGPPAAGRGGPSTGRQVTLTPRDLQELQPAGKLRAAGWELPRTISDDYLVRVYDTRVEPGYLLGLGADLGLTGEDSIFVVGGDFMTQTFKEDHVALCPTALRRWGPEGDHFYHLLVPPRPHLAEWFGRARQQLAVESPGAWISICCVVPRERCAPLVDLAAIKRMVPQAESVLTDSSLEVRVTAVGERAPVVRVPAGLRQLPPPELEHARLPLNRVLVVVSFRRREGPAVRPHGQWIRGALPAAPRAELELLRLEFMLAPATRQQAAERALRGAIRRLAETMGLVAPTFAQLRQIQPTHGGVVALLGVPRDQACRWLRGSGCGGLYVRPFWTDSTGTAVDRSKFSLVWMRGRLESGPKLWEAVHQLPGVYGLLPSSKDVAIRVSSEVDLVSLEAQVQFILGVEAAKFRRAVPGQRWWRFGPLTDAELWAVRDLVAQTGLVPLRDELRTARAGPFRTFCLLCGCWSSDSHQPR